MQHGSSSSRQPLRRLSTGCARGTLAASARSTPRVRAELQAAQASSRSLATQYGLNPKTVLKWRKRSTTLDAAMGPKARSTVLSEAEEAIVVEFRRRTLLPLDDVLGCLRDTIPKLTRSALHRCLLRHGISRFPPPAFQRLRRRNLGWLRPKTRKLTRNAKHSRRPRSATSTSTAPSFALPKARHTCSCPP